MRIVSLLPSTTEILFAIGAGDEVVGVTHECDYPEAARTRPVLTSAALPDAGSPAAIDRHVRAAVHAGSSLYQLDGAALERLQPDLIVTQELCEVCAVSYELVERAARRLKSDPRVVSLEPNTLDDVLSTVGTLGNLTAHAGEARALTAALRARFAAIRERPRSGERMLFLEWSDPPMSAGHWIPDLIEVAGADAVLADAGRKSRVLDWNAIANADPDVVVVAPCGFDRSRAQTAVSEIANDAWRSLRAVRNGRVHALDGNAYFSRPGPRLVESAALLARCLNERA